MSNIDQKSTAEESVWAAFRESDRLRKEAEAKFDREMAASSARFDRELAASSARFDREMAESSARFGREMAESRAEWEKRMKKMDEIIGGMSKSNGLHAEQYFINAFEHGKLNFFGEKFDAIKTNMKSIEPGIMDEYDILLINGKSVGVIEIKHRARLDDIPVVIRKAKTFKINYPKYKNHRVYLALAAMIFNQRLEQECIKKGIAIIKQVGKAVVIYDEHLKVY